MSSNQHDYSDALSKSILFFEGQRSGYLPNDQRMTWRRNSGLSDGWTHNTDLTGGYYDAGDNVKFNFPMAFTTTMLAWSVIEFGELMPSTELRNSLVALRWSSNYLLKSVSQLPNRIFVQASQYMQAPMESHWKMVNRILRYIRGTSDQGIWMGCNGSTDLVGYCDADYAGDRSDRRSTTGYCTFIGGNLVTWKSKKQKVVSCSSCEAEYRAMRRLTTELMWLKMLLKDLGIETPKPITMHCDNQAAIHIASNSVFHERTKHIEVDCHKVREQMQLGVILPCYTKSSDQLADIFTKPASSKTCDLIHKKLGLLSLSSS